MSDPVLSRQGTSTARLWVCHECEMIGEQDEAERHVNLKGHRVERLGQETSDAVREERRVIRARDISHEF